MLTKINDYVTPFSYSMIMARDERGGIGNGNGLPWPKNKVDFKWFRDNTLGKVILMGHRTWETLGSTPLAGRINCVLTTKRELLLDKEWRETQSGLLNGLVIYFSSINAFKKWLHQEVGSVKEVLAPAEKGNTELKIMGCKVQGEIMIIGGATVYQEFQNDINRIYLTTFAGCWEADTFLHIDLAGWEMRYHDSMSKLNPVFEIYTRQPMMDAAHGWIPGQRADGENNV